MNLEDYYRKNYGNGTVKEKAVTFDKPSPTVPIKGKFIYWLKHKIEHDFSTGQTKVLWTQCIPAEESEIKRQSYQKKKKPKLKGFKLEQPKKQTEEEVL